EQEVQLNDQSYFDIVLIATQAALDEVVVIGYGTQKKTEVTGSISTVSGAVLKRSPAINLSNALAGNVTGIIASSRYAEPGNVGSSILVGRASTLKAYSPSVVIDGIPDRGNLGRLDPNDVETITILKDGAGAIYGARAANGVILITTK